MQFFYLYIVLTFKFTLLNSLFSMKNLLLIFLAVVLAVPLCAQGEFFTPISNKQLPDLGNTRLYRTDKAHISELMDQKALADYLAQAPHEGTAQDKNGLLIELPNPDGSATPFRIVRYTMIHPSVQAVMPNAVTAYGADTEGKGLSLSLSYTSAGGISAMVRGGKNGRWMIDPVFAGDNRFFQSFYTKDSPATVEHQCLVEDNVRDNIDQGAAEDKILDDCRLRTYDLAIACTGEYFNYMVDTHGDGTNDGGLNDYTTVLQRIMISVNRINQVYREEIAVVFTLVNQVEMDTVQLLYNDAAEDEYVNTDASQMLNVNTDVINDAIGAASYDIGHVFATSLGGVATTGLCDNNNKGNGVSGSLLPEMDAFDVDLVAHEIGHQLGARHTFNSTEGSCGNGNRSGVAAFEPGSGSTIMAYANICAPDDVQFSSDPYFHVVSLEEISAELVSGTANSCASFSTGNLEPTIEAGQNYNVPLNTPFILTAVGADPDGGTLTYTWEQYFNAATTALDGEPTGAETNTPLFRSRPPTTEPERYFPTLQSVINGVTTGDWETLPTVAQTLTFKATVRDGVANGNYGCPQTDEMQVTFVNTNAQFGVSSPNGGESFTTNSNQTITWNDAGTRTNGINCANVDILLSLDGGLTYPQTLATATPNDGSHNVTIPATTTSTARIMVRCSDNIFYDISKADFTIEATEFTLDGDTNEASICSGSNEAIFTIDVGSSQGYTGSIDLSITTGLPAGATVAFSTDPVVFNAGNVNTTQTVTVTVSNLAAVADGDYTITLQADDGSSTMTTNLMLNLGAGPITIISPADNSEQLEGEDVDFTFLSVEGLNRYIISYQYTSGGLTFSGTTGRVFTPAPPAGQPITVSATLGDMVGNVISWSITASDDNNVNPDAVSCPRSYVLVDILPVTWLNFTAQAVGKTARLNWAVEQDEFNAGFGVERSLSGSYVWQQVGYVSTDNISGQTAYAYTDETVSPGNSYNYRLRQEDADGQRSFSEIRTVAFGADAGLVLRPNPAGDFALLNVGGTTEKLQFELYNSLGQRVNMGSMTDGFARVNLSGLPTAVYQVVVSGNEGYREVARLVKR